VITCNSFLGNFAPRKNSGGRSVAFLPNLFCHAAGKSNDRKMDGRKMASTASAARTAAFIDAASTFAH
jgi:hypothetical protein